MSFYRTTHIILFLVISLGSCTTQDVCDEDSQSELVARFKTRHPESVTDTTISGLYLYGIRKGLPDSLLVDSLPVQQIMLPLDPHHDTSQFVMRAGSLADTLQIVHSREFYMISYTCGFATRFTIDTIHYNGRLIHEHEIINHTIDAELKLNEEHLWLYF